MSSAPFTPSDYRPAYMNQVSLNAEQSKRLADVMNGFEKADCLSDRERQFLQGQVQRYRKFKSHLGVTDRQWAWFEAIHRKMFPQEKTR